MHTNTHKEDLKIVREAPWERWATIVLMLGVIGIVTVIAILRQ